VHSGSQSSPLGRDVVYCGVNDAVFTAPAARTVICTWAGVKSLNNAPVHRPGLEHVNVRVSPVDDVASTCASMGRKSPKVTTSPSSQPIVVHSMVHDPDVIRPLANTTTKANVVLEEVLITPGEEVPTNTGTFWMFELGRKSPANARGNLVAV
jgi:hypothetical protein